MERDTTTIHDEYIASNFNSHAHVERDVVWRVAGVTPAISTHTLTWSVTFVTQREKIILTISTHTLTWSVTFAPKSSQSTSLISTHTLTWSVTANDIRRKTLF